GCAGDEGVRPLDTCPVIAAAATFALAVGGIDSCRVPQDPHARQRPSHLGETYAHSEQVWMGRCFLAMSSYSSRPARHCISPGSEQLWCKKKRRPKQRMIRGAGFRSRTN